MSKSKKIINPKVKIKLVKQYLSGEISSLQAARKVGVSYSSFIVWVRLYRSGGPEALLKRKSRYHYSEELKLKAVKEYLAGGIGQNALCEKYNIRSRRQIQQWLEVYNTYGTFKFKNGGSYMRKARNTTYEERLKIVRDSLTSGKSYGDMALKYNVSYPQVWNWIKKYKKMGSKGLEDRRGHTAGTQESRTPEEKLRDRIAQLEREKSDLQMENDILKKVQELERRNHYR